MRLNPPIKYWYVYTSLHIQCSTCNSAWNAFTALTLHFQRLLLLYSEAVLFLYYAAFLRLLQNLIPRVPVPHLFVSLSLVSPYAILVTFLFYALFSFLLIGFYFKVRFLILDVLVCPVVAQTLYWIKTLRCWW